MNVCLVPRLIRFLLCAAGAWAGIASVAPAAEPPPPPARLRVGVEGGRSGAMSFLDAQRRPSGFTRDLFDAITRTAGIEFELIPGSWKDLTANFAAGQLDVLANVLMTEERRATMDFSIPHATMHGVAYFRAGSPRPRRTADFAGKRIGVLTGTMEWRNAVQHGGWGGTVVEFTSVDALFDGLAGGKSDLVLLTRRLDRQAIKAQGLKSDFIDDIIHEFRFAVHKGDRATLTRLNDALLAVHRSGDFDTIYAKWIGPIEPHPLRLADLRPYVVPAAAVIFAVAFVIVWQRRMLAQRAVQAKVLRETEERYRGLVDSAFDGSVIHQDGVIRTVNAAYAAMFGYAEKELIGRPIAELTPVELRAGVAVKVSDGVEVPYESVGLRKDGSHIRIEIAGKGCSYEGRPARIAAVRNITERKAAEEAVRRLNGELEARVQERTAELAGRVTEIERLYLEQDDLLRRVTASQAAADRAAARLQEVNSNLLAANQELEAFSYSVSHDLRAPLRNIAGFIELLGKRASGRLDPEAERFVAVITTEAGRMSNLIDDLLTFSKIGRTELVREPLALETLVAEVREELRVETADRVVEWRIGALPTVLGDRALLRQVVANLLSNAVKFTRRRPDAVIEFGAKTARSGDGQVTFFVRDNGAGFNPKYLDKLFGVFQRLHNARDFEGTGIGLANVKRIVSRHGGRVWAEGAVDAGACFYFTLPVAAAPTP